MARGSELVSFETYDAEIQDLFAFLKSHGADVPNGGNFLRDAYEAFSLLYYHVFADERPVGGSGADLARTQAGLGDIAAKINKAVRAGHAKEIAPHLLEMVKGSALMNRRSGGQSDPADKTSELYLGCLAINAGFSVDIEDPVRSANGKNPDVILNTGQKDWAFAVKTVHGFSYQSLYELISGGVRQIDRCHRDGVVWVNLKNRIDSTTLIDPSLVHPTEASAVAAVTSVVNGIADNLRAAIVDDDWKKVFNNSRCRPIVAVTGQAVVNLRVGEQILWTPVRVLRALRVPPAPDKPAELNGLDAEGVEVLKKLNCELQWNPPRRQSD